MKKVAMRTVVLFIIGLLVGGASIVPSIGGSSVGTAIFSTSTTDDVQITVQNNGDTIQLQYNLDMFTMTPVLIQNTEYVQISLGDEPQSLIAGAPDLPSIHRSIIISDTQKMAATVIDATYKEYSNIQITPSKGNLPRTINPDEIPYQFGQVYSTNSWYPQTIVELQDPYILRDFRGQVVVLNPFQYNPIERTLRFYNKITIKIIPTGLDTINTIEREHLPTTIDADFYQVYQHHFINIDTIFNERYTPVEEQGNMIIITYDNFYNAMLPFYEWKILKGIPTEMINVSTLGSASAIKTYIANYYNTKGLTFVLLVGDAAQIPPSYLGGAASDPSNTYVVGNDHYPDLFIGRFSAETIAQVETQVLRSVEYERDPQTTAEWYHKGMGVASSQGAGTGDDGEADYVHMGNLRALLLDYTYTEVDEIYDPTATATMVTNGLNAGRSIVNYCGHGSPTSWGTTGFSNTNVNALVNLNMLPFVFSVACNNGEFDTYTCFAEAWLRATNNNEPTGAIGAFMSTISMSWAPPMEAQDEFVNLTVQIHPDNIKTTLGGLTAHGCMSMNDKYGSSGTGETDYWTLFGDPSLQLRTDTPTSMNVDHDPLIQIGATIYELDILGVKNALCAISADGVLYGYGYSDASGHAVVNFFEPIEFMPEAQLGVTAYNKIPYITTLQVGSSYPPAIPTLDGPNAGCRNMEYTFTAQTTDPEGDNIYYLFDWGDGTKSDWIGPVNSGVAVSESHAWTDVGLYNVTVRAKDENGSMSRWSDPHGMLIDVPVLDIKLTKGKIAKISATIRNLGFAEAENVSWKISLDGGTLLLGKERTGTISIIPAGDNVEIQTGLIFGFGKTQITITAEVAESKDTLLLKATVIFFLVIMTSGGG